MELDCLKRVWTCLLSENACLWSPIIRCSLLRGNVSSCWYCKTQVVASVDLDLMRRIDERYALTPFYGIRGMKVPLHEQRYRVHVKRIRRLMRLMGLEAIYPKPKLSKKDDQHKVFAYLLRGLKIDRPD